MSTTVIAPESTPPAATPPTTSTTAHDPALRASVPRAIRSEWIKLSSLRSTWWTLGALFSAIVVFGLISSAVAGGQVTAPGQGGGFSGSSPLQTVLSGANFGVLLVAVLGVLVGAREYSSGLIRTSLAVVPRRWPVLFGKVVTFVAVVTPVTLAGVLIAFFGGTALLTNAGVDSVAWGDPNVASTVFGTVGYLVGIGVLGVALGILLRGIGAGLGVLIGGVLFVPTLLGALLPDSWGTILKYLPSSAGNAITGAQSTGDMLGYWAAVGVFAAWVVTALAGAVWALRRRDA
jgi:ABC-type transport system involved in multi-copper enzyme maturation permease subunit